MPQYIHQDDALNPYMVGIEKKRDDGWKNEEKSDDEPLFLEQKTLQSLKMPLQKHDENVSKLVKFENNNDVWKLDENPEFVEGKKTEITSHDGGQIEYFVEGFLGLCSHEFPVKGVHVDHRITPGFKYRVRLLGHKNKHLLEARALHLVNVGQGYGKRITFHSDLHNINENYFWSDSSDYGYGFSLVAVEGGDVFTICSLRRRPIGRVLVEGVDASQMELETDVNDTDITKEVSVRMQCRLRYTCEPHGLRSLRAEETVILNGIAVVTKTRNNPKAVTKLIKNIELASIGFCLFVNEQ